MLDKLAVVSSGHTFLDFPQEPIVIVDEALYRFLRERFRVAAPIRSESRQLRFQIRREMHFHVVGLLGSAHSASFGRGSVGPTLLSAPLQSRFRGGSQSSPIIV